MKRIRCEKIGNFLVSFPSRHHINYIIVDNLFNTFFSQYIVLPEKWEDWYYFEFCSFYYIRLLISLLLDVILDY